MDAATGGTASLSVVGGFAIIMTGELHRNTQSIGQHFICPPQFHPRGTGSGLSDSRLAAQA
jgi:hypothetical protein